MGLADGSSYTWPLWQPSSCQWWALLTAQVTHGPLRAIKLSLMGLADGSTYTWPLWQPSSCHWWALLTAQVTHGPYDSHQVVTDGPCWQLKLHMAPLTAIKLSLMGLADSSTYTWPLWQPSSYHWWALLTAQVTHGPSEGHQVGPWESVVLGTRCDSGPPPRAIVMGHVVCWVCPSCWQLVGLWKRFITSRTAHMIHVVATAHSISVFSIKPDDDSRVWTSPNTWYWLTDLLIYTYQTYMQTIEIRHSIQWK